MHAWHDQLQEEGRSLGQRFNSRKAVKGLNLGTRTDTKARREILQLVFLHQLEEI